MNIVEKLSQLIATVKGNPSLLFPDPVWYQIFRATGEYHEKNIYGNWQSYEINTSGAMTSNDIDRLSNPASVVIKRSKLASDLPRRLQHYRFRCQPIVLMANDESHDEQPRKKRFVHHS